MPDRARCIVSGCRRNAATRTAKYFCASCFAGLAKADQKRLAAIFLKQLAGSPRDFRAWLPGLERAITWAARKLGLKERTCGTCGCTDAHGCGACEWVDWDLCSACLFGEEDE